MVGLVLLLISLAGCNDLRGFGVSSWPLYPQLPPQNELSGAEKTAIADRLTDEQITRLKVLTESEAYYRTIVFEHNKKAIEQRKKVQQVLGAEEEDLKAYEKVWLVRVTPNP